MNYIRLMKVSKCIEFCSNRKHNNTSGYADNILKGNISFQTTTTFWLYDGFRPGGMSPSLNKQLDEYGDLIGEKLTDASEVTSVNGKLQQF